MPTRASVSFTTPPEEAIDYLREKGYRLTFDYDEMRHEAHHKSFTVAKVARADLLAAIHQSLLDAQRDGTKFETWKKGLLPTLSDLGWWGEVEITDPKTGVTRVVDVNSRRLENIYRTNMYVARAASRCRQQREAPQPYWQYLTKDDDRTRPLHQAQHQKVRHKDDPWWRTNYPPNGWGCRCDVRALSAGQVKRYGYEIEPKNGDGIATEDWAYDMCPGSNLATAKQLHLDDTLQSVPPTSQLEELGDAALKEQFYRALDARPGDLHIDRIGDPMVVSDDILTGATLKKHKSAVVELARAISDPDIIYLEFADGGWIKKMVRYLRGDRSKVIVAAFEYLRDKTLGITAFVTTAEAVSENARIAYQKESVES